MPALELGRALEAVVHLHRAPDELVAAGTFHAIHAQVGAADADGVLGRPGASRVVLRRYQAMPRVDRRCNRGAEVHVAQAQNQVARAEDDVLDVFDASRAR